MSKRSLIIFLTLFTLIITQGTFIAKAQEVIVRSSEVTEPITNERGTYMPFSEAVMFKLLWRFGVYDITDREAINQLMMATNCELYAQYIHDDFAWNRILESKKRELSYFSDIAPERFVVGDVINLSRYDFKENVFFLNSASVMSNAGIIELFQRGDFNMKLCNNIQARSLSKYPLMYTIKLDNPLSVESFPISPNEAEKLINDFQAKGNVRREMFARIYMRLSGTDKVNINNASSDNVQFAGQVERFEIFGDIDYKNLVYSKDFR